MIITYHGVDYFKVSFGDTTIAVNPISKDSKLKSTRFGSDITLVSLNSPEHNGVEVNSRGEKEPFLIKGPGEYEVSGIFIKGFLSKSQYGGSQSLNTIYTVSLEGMNLCFLGALSDTQLSDEAKEAIEEVDILFVPIGGDGVLDASTAHKLAVQFEPKLIIPSHFGDVGDSGALKKFLKEEKFESHDKLSTGLGTNDMKSHLVVIDKMKIGKTEIKNYKTVVIDLSHVNVAYKQMKQKPIDGVLGSDILKKYKAVIDYGKKKLIFS